MKTYRDHTKLEYIGPVYKNPDYISPKAAQLLLQACHLAKDFIGNGIEIINDHAPSGTFKEISEMHGILFKAISEAEA